MVDVCASLNSPSMARLSAQTLPIGSPRTCIPPSLRARGPAGAQRIVALLGPPARPSSASAPARTSHVTNAAVASADHPLGVTAGAAVGAGAAHATNGGALNVAVLGAAGVAAAAALASSGSSLPDLYAANVAADPVGTKAIISGTVYLLGDLIAQAAGEGRGPAAWDRGRALRSGLVGALAHGPLSHCYYLGLDALAAHLPLVGGGGGGAGDGMASLFFKIGVDQTVWSLAWNAAYCGLLGLLRGEAPRAVAADARAAAWPLLKAGWRIWPLAHVVTYGLIPTQHRLLFVDGVELAWVAILSLTCAAGAEARSAQQGQQQPPAEQAAAAEPTRAAAPLPFAAGDPQ